MLRFLLPSTDLDIRSLRLALLNYIKALQDGKSFYIRINDLKSESNKSEQIGLEILKKFAIDTQNSLYMSNNLSIYQQMVQRLVKESKAYACFCNKHSACQCASITKKDLQYRIDKGEKFSIKIVKPHHNIVIKDLLLGKINHDLNEVGSFTILTSSGLPTTIFAVAVDDMASGITTVVEEQENSIATARILYIQEQLGFLNRVSYYHLPTLKSKTKQTLTIEYLLQEGYLPDAIIEYLLSLSAPIEGKISYLPDAINNFDFASLYSETKRDFSIEELREFNRKHLKWMDAKKLSLIFSFADRDIGEFLKLFLDDAATINELEEYFTPLFQKKECNKIEKKLSELILDAPYFQEYADFKSYLLSKSNLEEAEFEKALRRVLTGKEKGPNLDIIYSYIKSYLLEVAQCH